MKFSQYLLSKFIYPLTVFIPPFDFIFLFAGSFPYLFILLLFFIFPLRITLLTTVHNSRRSANCSPPSSASERTKLHSSATTSKPFVLSAWIFCTARSHSPLILAADFEQSLSHLVSSSSIIILYHNKQFAALSNSHSIHKQKIVVQTEGKD